MLIDAGEQGLRFGVQHLEPGILASQLHGLFLDLLGLYLDPLDLDQLRVHTLLVAGIATPVERRAQVARCIGPIRQKVSPPRQR